MSAQSPNLTEILMTPGDPAVANAWGANLNTNFSIVDLAVGGTLSLSVAGSSNVILTDTAGGLGQAKNANFIFTGVLTGNIIVFWPLGYGRMFSVQNSTTGAFTLTLAVNNGSGSPDGATQTVAPGSSGMYYSDGTNINNRLGSLTGTGAYVLANNPILTTPALGVATATSLAIGGASISGKALAVTGAAGISGPVNGMQTGYNGSPTVGGTDTGITATAITIAKGVFLIAYCAAQNGTGDFTYSAIYMLRFPNTGAAVTATRIALDAGSTGLGDFTFSVNGSNHLVVTAPATVNTQVIIQQMTG